MPEEIILGLSWVVFHGFLSQMKSNLFEYFTSDAMQHFDLLLHPISPEYGQNQGQSKQSVKKCSHQAIQICQSQDFLLSCLNEK